MPAEHEVGRSSRGDAAAPPRHRRRWRDGAAWRIRRGAHIVRHAGFPWPTPPAAGTPEVARLIRRHGRAAILRSFPRALRPAAAVLMACLWPLGSLLTARREARRIAADAFPGRTRRGLVRAAWHVALRHNVPPLEFFAYRLPDRPEVSPDAWVYDREVTRLLGWLSRPEATSLAADKLAFARFCERNGLVAVATLGRIGPGEAPGEPDLARVVVKPRSGGNAHGVSVLACDETGWRFAGEAEGANWSALVERIRPQSGAEMLVQPVLPLHPRLAGFAGGGSPAARIVTGLRPSGEVEALSASFAVPRPGSAASNAGPRRMVDLGSGRLLPVGPGRARDVFGESHACPAMDDLELPDWTEAVRIALAGHRAFPPRAVLLGWDVAFTPEGPVMIETNTGLSFFLEQYESLVPAGGQPGAALLAAWLE